jgi:hypothetical protein
MDGKMHAVAAAAYLTTTVIYGFKMFIGLASDKINCSITYGLKPFDQTTFVQHNIEVFVRQSKGIGTYLCRQNFVIEKCMLVKCLYD